MSRKTSTARHRAVPTRINPIVKASRAVTSAGKPAAVAIAASGILLGAALPASASGEVYTAPVQSGSYTVQAGDTLGSIAAAHGVSLDTLFAANSLGYGSVIYPGQALSLVAPVAAPAQYSVQSAVVAAPVYTAPVEAPAAEVYSAPTTFAAAAQAPAEYTYSVQAPAGAINPITNGGYAATPAPAPAPAAPVAPPAAGNGITGTAMQGLGGSYVYGGTGFKAWDCSGFVQWVYAQNGISLPRTTWAQFGSMRPTSNPQPGDLVSQNGGGHVGIYLGNGQMISALNPAQGTQVHSVNAMQLDGYYTR